MTQLHLSDDRLIEVCLLEAASIAEQAHLGACARCDARRARLRSLLDDVSGAAVAETDAVFPPDRLARQQARILSQLQHDGRPGRLIAFPAGHTHEPAASRTRPSTRWIAAAAVAGLVIGVLAGRFGHDYSLGRPGGTRIAVTRSADAPELRTGAILEISTAVSEEEFLSQIEIAIDGPAAAALQPLDDLTPLPWEVR
jgi:anti-sigma factor RsiW